MNWDPGTAEKITVKPSGASLGADIAGIDISAGITGEQLRQIYTAWNHHLVLRFQRQQLDDNSLVEFSLRFGRLDDAPTRPANVPYHPSRKEITVLSDIIEDGKSIGGLGNSELVWHQDMRHNDLPPKASLLYGLETPAVGGDTSFYNLYEVYETLPQSLKERIASLTCKHDATQNFAVELRASLEESYSNEDRPGAIYPLAIRHGDTERIALYLGRRPNA